MDKSSLSGVLIAVVGILAGLLLEGGKLSQIIQPTAAMIVFGGTIGVGAANLLFLPSAGKLKIRIRTEQQMREMMLEGVISILEGLNPRMVEIRLQSFLADPVQSEESRESS